MPDEFDFQGFQEIKFDNRQVALKGKQSERAFTLTTRYPDQPPDAQTVRHKHGSVASENAVMHARIRPGRFVLGPVQKDPSKHFATGSCVGRDKHCFVNAKNVVLLQNFRVSDHPYSRRKNRYCCS